MPDAIKERPILFNAAMVRAVKSGRKTQTRRVAEPLCCPIGPQYDFELRGDRVYAKDAGRGWTELRVDKGPRGEGNPYRCPYGVPGDRLWVREAFSPDHAAFYPHYPYVYRADGYPDKWEIVDGHVESPEAGDKRFPFKWHPSIHMPRRASRILLEVTGVRVERVQEISAEDARAEGIDRHCLPVITNGAVYGWRDYTDPKLSTGPGYHLEPQGSFGSLWDTVAKPGQKWIDNPWVWAVSFRCIEGGDAA